MKTNEMNDLLKRVGIEHKVYPGDLLGEGLFPLFNNIISRLEALEARELQRIFDQEGDQ